MPGPADIDVARDHAIEVLKRSASATGFVASSADAHYTSLWARDSAYSIMGAVVSGDAALAAASRASLLTLAKIQADNGQIPDAYWPARDYWDWGEAGSTDASALFVVAAGEYLRNYPDAGLRAQLWPHLVKAVQWLETQDANQFGLLDSPEGGDWMDSSLCRSGKVLYVNVLYQRAVAILGRLAHEQAESIAYGEQAARIKERINFLFWPERGPAYSGVLRHHRGRMTVEGFPHPASPAAWENAALDDRKHYISHVQWGRFVDECDTLGNILAVLFDIAGGARAERMMRHLLEDGAAAPYPVRTYTRSFRADDRWGMYKEVADQFQGERWRNPPGSYHNGAVWPFIGGLYVDALRRVGMEQEAASELQRLAEANRLAADGGEWGFHEWIHAETGEPGGAKDQTWSAATFVLAHRGLSGG